MKLNRKEHWETVYETKSPNQARLPLQRLVRRNPSRLQPSHGLKGLHQERLSIFQPR